MRSDLMKICLLSPLTVAGTFLTVCTAGQACVLDFRRCRQWRPAFDKRVPQLYQHLHAPSAFMCPC